MWLTPMRCNFNKQSNFSPWDRWFKGFANFFGYLDFARSVKLLGNNCPLNTRRKLNVHNTFRWKSYAENEFSNKNHFAILEFKKIKWVFCSITIFLFFPVYDQKVNAQNHWNFNPLSANFTKWSNTLKHFVGNSRRIVWVCLNILWDWCLKG